MFYVNIVSEQEDAKKQKIVSLKLVKEQIEGIKDWSDMIFKKNIVSA